MGYLTKGIASAFLAAASISSTHVADPLDVNAGVDFTFSAIKGSKIQKEDNIFSNYEDFSYDYSFGLFGEFFVTESISTGLNASLGLNSHERNLIREEDRYKNKTIFFRDALVDPKQANVFCEKEDKNIGEFLSNADSFSLQKDGNTIRLKSGAYLFDLDKLGYKVEDKMTADQKKKYSDASAKIAEYKTTYHKNVLDAMLGQGGTENK